MQKNPSQDAVEKIDMFSHVIPRKYNEVLLKKSRPCYYLEANSLRPALTNLDSRFKGMDKFEGLRNVVTLGSPPPEYASPLGRMNITEEERAKIFFKNARRILKLS